MWRTTGGEARRANLKLKARYIAQSVAEMLVYCTLITVSIEIAILQTCENFHISFFFFMLIFSCILHAVSSTAYYYKLCIFDIYCIHFNILHIFCTDAHKCLQVL